MGWGISMMCACLGCCYLDWDVVDKPADDFFM